MATVWSPAPYIDKQEWLLADGSIVTSPEFETTSSGRRVRIVGTTVSAGSRQVNDLITTAIDQVARDRGTTRWLRLFSNDTEQAYRTHQVPNVDSDVFKKAAVLHLNKPGVEHSNAYDHTAIIWDYKADGLPIFATVFAVLDQRGQRVSIRTHVIWRDTNPNQDQTDHPLYSSYDGSNIGIQSLYRHAPQFQAMQTAVDAQGGILPGIEMAAQRTYGSQFRRAIKDFAAHTKALDNLDELHLPDMRDPDNPTLMKFRRTASNYSASVHHELLAVVQTGPLLETIQRSYTELVGAMSALGIVFTSKPGDNAFVQAANGDLTALRATVQPTEDANTANTDGVDHHHSVVLDFATGSVIVNCARSSGSGQDTEAIEAWNIAKFKAELTGEVDVLLAYAQAYRSPREQARIKKILDQRAVPEE